MIITIDGPMASGKSSVAQELSKRLNFHCLSSGMLYRALAFILLEHFGYTAETLADPKTQDIERALDPKRFSYTIDTKGCGTFFFDGDNITSLLKSVAVSQASSMIAVHRSVRHALTRVQRSLAHHYDLIVEGRDSGSVIFPDASIKFFLTASLDQRAKRWQGLQKKQGVTIGLDEAKQHIQERDTRDRNRPISPLIIPQDALVIDNSSLNLSQTVDAMMEHIKRTL